MICTSVTATTVKAFVEEIAEAVASGVDIVELRLDYIKDFDAERDLEPLMQACQIPYIVTFRPQWEGGNYDGPEPQRLATLKFAALKGAPYIDVEYEAAHCFFAGAGEVPVSTSVILSHHNFSETPDLDTLRSKARAMRAAGADIVKIAALANDITDCDRILALLRDNTGPTIALAMGERGQLVRLLAARYGGFLTFAAMSPSRASAPGQPTVQQLRSTFRFARQQADTAAFGVIGNPVSHSRSPAIHNAAFEALGFNGVYVPLLVDDLPLFLDTFGRRDFQGFSVTIPHKEAALAAADSVDDVAQSIGAVNTLVRQPDGTFRGYNTDWSAAVAAIERGLADTAAGGGAGPASLDGATVVVLGAGGAGRALAFGSASRGAKVIIVNRNRARAKALAAAVPGGAAEYVGMEEMVAGQVAGDVLVNTTSVGMHPQSEESPVPPGVLFHFRLVFDAVYTPRDTRLLRDARSAGCATVDGVRMFVGQALEQSRLFTGQEPPADVMEAAMLQAAQH